MDSEVRETVEEIARQVYGTLRGGYNESVYQQAMAIEFRERGIAYEMSNTREVFYWAVLEDNDYHLGELTTRVLVGDAAGLALQLRSGVSLSGVWEATMALPCSCHA